MGYYKPVPESRHAVGNVKHYYLCHKRSGFAGKFIVIKRNRQVRGKNLDEGQRLWMCCWLNRSHGGISHSFGFVFYEFEAFMELWLSEKLKYSKQKLTLLRWTSDMSCPGMNSGLCDKKSWQNHLSYGVACYNHHYYPFKTQWLLYMKPV
jgi:hypothetical protein